MIHLMFYTVRLWLHLNSLLISGLFIHESASYAGGIYGTEKDIEIKKPKNLSAEELEAIFKFFQIIGYKIMASAFGTKLEFPKL